jgi:osmotically-inducible protein OsmY
MLVVPATGTEPDKQSPDSRTGIRAAAERALHSGPYPALRRLACEYGGGVLILRGCLPSYYLKQTAQEVVARLEGVAAIDNRIQVVRENQPAGVRYGAPDADERVEDSPVSLPAAPAGTPSPG